MSGPVRFTGRAADAKGGAVVVTDDGLESWPREFAGRAVVVTGTLVSEKRIPDPSPGPLRTAGAYGPQTIVKDARWRLEESGSGWSARLHPA